MSFQNDLGITLEEFGAIRIDPGIYLSGAREGSTCSSRHRKVNNSTPVPRNSGLVSDKVFKMKERLRKKLKDKKIAVTSGTPSPSL